jgi:rhodanese-related sulfurtransferase
VPDEVQVHAGVKSLEVGGSHSATVAVSGRYVYYPYSLCRQLVFRRGFTVSTTLSPPAGALGIAEILDAARARLSRVTALQAAAEAAAGAVLVDIRPAAQRAAEGEIPDALIVERNVLEWRLDPRSDHRLPIATYGLRVIVFCSEGYTSSLAAASLLDLGIARATDLEGGFSSWRAAGLPVR